MAAISISLSMPETTLFDIGTILSELGARLCIKVDVLTPAALPARTRSTVLAGAVPK